MKNKVLLIGARGVGKTTLLRRWEKQSQDRRQWLDLDDIIAKKNKMTVQDFFDSKGEKAFRFEEHMALIQLLRDPAPMTIAIGAGFEWDHWHWPNQRKDIEVIWIARESDEAGRIFVDRPRLEAALSQLEEYRERYTARLKNYRKVSDWTYLMPEGDYEISPEETSILEGTYPALGGILTLHPHHLSDGFFAKLKEFQFDFIEVRDDLWDFSQLIPLRKKLREANQKILWAVRDGQNDILKLAEKDDIVDWALEISGEPPKGVAVVSSHGANPPTHSRMHLKWSPIHENWASVIEGIQWQGENPAGRSYLPRSKDGRWRWLRLWQKNRQQLNFVRDSVGTVMDQPTIHEWLRAVSSPQKFAAVIGDPVSFSWSPMEHFEFFKKKNMPFYAIAVRRGELHEAMPILEGLGLKALAITAPLKEEAFTWAKTHSEACVDLQSANTLVLKDGQWLAANTDVIGLASAKQEFKLGDHALVWGGGGTMSSVKKIFPKAQFFSVRTGQGRPGNSESALSDLVIWAGGPDANLPPGSWHPKTVLDLNYFESSRGREYAIQHQAKYIPGTAMFHSQAKAQQELWDRLLR